MSHLRVLKILVLVFLAQLFEIGVLVLQLGHNVSQLFNPKAIANFLLISVYRYRGGIVLLSVVLAINSIELLVYLLKVNNFGLLNMEATLQSKGLTLREVRYVLHACQNTPASLVQRVKLSMVKPL